MFMVRLFTLVAKISVTEITERLSSNQMWLVQANGWSSTSIIKLSNQMTVLNSHSTAPPYLTR